MPTFPAAQGSRAYPSAQTGRVVPAAQSGRTFPSSDDGDTPLPPYIGDKAGRTDGVDEYLTGPTKTLNPATGFGFSCWVQIANTTAEKVLVHVRESSTRQFGVYTNGATLVSYIQRTTLFSVTSGSVLSANTWFHVVVAVDQPSSTRIRSWINGSLVGTTTGTTTGTVVGGSAFGRVQNTASWYLNGKICDIAFWTGSISDAEAAAMHNASARQDPELLSGKTAANLWAFQASDSMVGGAGPIVDLKGGTSLTPLNTEADDLVDGPP